MLALDQGCVFDRGHGHPPHLAIRALGVGQIAKRLKIGRGLGRPLIEATAAERFAGEPAKLSAGALPAAPAREYGLARGTEIAAVLGEASNDALLVGDELVAEPEYVVGAGLLVGLTSTEGFLRARGGQHR